MWALAVTAFALRIPLAFRPVHQLTLLPYGDDAYYLFSIARNLANGLGPTVDGHHLTNGFQPLFTFLYVPLFCLSANEQWLAVRLSFILAGLVAAASVWMTAFVLRSLVKPESTQNSMSIPIIGALLWTFSFQIFAQTTNGLETGLYSFLLLTVIALYSQFQTAGGSKSSRAIWLGVVLGVTVLTRIDAAILVTILFIAETIKRRKKQALTFTAVAFLISLPWWIYNAIYFGNLMPTSGQAENIWPIPPSENFRRAIQAVTDIFLLIFYAPDSLDLSFRIVLVVVCAAVLIIVIRDRRFRASIRNRVHFSYLLPFFLFGIVLVVYYTLFFRAPHFIARYLQPLRIVWLLAVATSLPTIYRILLDRWKKLVPTLAVIVLISVIAFDGSRYTKNYLKANDAEFYDIGKFASSHPNDKIGMLQSGIASFVSPNVINLDGKVNTDALHAHQQGRLASYLHNENFVYIADLKPFIEDIATTAHRNELFFDSVGMIGRIQIMKLHDASPRLRN